MEKLIIICLLFLILLILPNRRLLIRKRRKNPTEANNNWVSIMGETKQIERQTLPSEARGGQSQYDLSEKDTFKSEIREEEFSPVDRTKNINDIRVRNADSEKEDANGQYEYFTTESGLATGVTFQELKTAGQLIQQNMLEPGLERQAVDIIQKIHGTELFDLLENSLEDGPKRIAGLLNRCNSNED
ncbi:hypothetical protein J2799_001677 [Chryseobacterium vietnamense]|uniref:hypothetical protein n=1 Tax=Chryseobacterium vietnamense TaxID=866785 RepID=UPI002854EFE8|nr:hypothetical protein [Chryseobacterium vietnamense]MDR6487192.1 hypothetical protein [Chryseobacterium vietnamense]